MFMNKGQKTYEFFFVRSFSAPLRSVLPILASVVLPNIFGIPFFCVRLLLP